MTYKKIKKRIKNFIKIKIIRNANYIIYALKNVTKKNAILIISPATLNGSFGDDLMVVTCLENYKDRPVGLLCNDTVIRDDIFDKYKNIEYLSWKDKINLSFYTEVVLLGADNLTGSYGDEEPIYKLDILKSANLKGIKNKVLGFSIKENISSSISSKMRELVPGTLFNMRDVDSFSRAKKILPESNIQLVADLAFLCPYKKGDVSLQYKNWISQQKSESRHIVGVCPNAYQADKIGKIEYCKKFVDSLSKLIVDKNISYVFMYSDIRAHCEGMSDKDISRNIYNELSQFDNVFFVENLINGVMLKPYLDYVDFTITARMHFGISGYSLGKPMVGISYEEKFTGLQKLFEVDAKNSLINYTELDKLPIVIDTFLQNYIVYKENTEKNLSKIKKMSKLNFID